jgi:ABC-2 type transport system permease protein
MSTAAIYTRFELLRTIRNRRFFILSLVFPLVLFLVVAGPNRHAHLAGIPFPLYYMSGMVTWGTMAAVVGAGARISQERSVGWTRQLRLTPLPAGTYIRAKVLTGYLMAIVSMVLLYLAGASMGVHLDAGSWLKMSGLILVGLIPFAALGIALGHMLTVEAMGPALGGIVSLFALLGGAWGPIGESGVMHTIAQSLPSYWLVQAGKIAAGGGGWPARAWVVIGLWSAAFLWLAVHVYRRDTTRV